METKPTTIFREESKSSYLLEDKDWLEMKALMIEGDEIREFSHFESYSGFVSGEEGYILLRNGKEIAKVVTAVTA